MHLARRAKTAGSAACWMGSRRRDGCSQNGAAQGGDLGGLASLIDLDVDGNPINDILGMAGPPGR